jgi:hypothetical protein
MKMISRFRRQLAVGERLLFTASFLLIVMLTFGFLA